MAPKTPKIFNNNNESVKQSTKLRHQRKFDCLLSCSTSDVVSHSDQITSSQLSDSPVADMPIMEEPVEDRVTAIQVHLISEEQALLALGPNFALTTRIDESLMESVKVEIAACAYRLRGMTFTKNTASCSTPLQQLKQKSCPFQKPFASAPPTFNVEIEDSLKQLQTFIVRQISQAKVKFNLTHSQAAGLKSLQGRRSKLHISVSDKGGEFVVMEKNQHKDLTTHHIMSTSMFHQQGSTKEKCRK